jgi:GNAT superfamily N-acetyltransferase
VRQLWLVLRRASPDDYGAVIGLQREAEDWLRTMSTDQWAQAWPSEDVLEQRIREAIRVDRTWIAWDGAVPAATVTASPNHHEIWPGEARRDRAVYVRRLVVSRDPKYAGHGLGAQLLDWAGLRASREYGARWVRVDIRTTNTKLHKYYRDQGFGFCGFCEWIADYPSAALFQKPIDEIKPVEDILFREADER